MKSSSIGNRVIAETVPWEPTCAHSYVLPTLFSWIEGIAHGRSLRILDLGCGVGHVSKLLADRGHQVVGVDRSPRAIAAAQQNVPEVQFHCAALEEESLPALLPSPVDCVIAVEVIEHLYAPGTLFALSRRLLRPGGSLILSTPYHGYMKNLLLSVTNQWERHFHVHVEGGHIKFFTKRALEQMATRHQFCPAASLGVGRLPGVWKSLLFHAVR